MLEDEIDKVIKDDDAIAKTLENRRSCSPTKRSEHKTTFGASSTVARTNVHSPLRRSPKRDSKTAGEMLDNRASHHDLRRKSVSPDRFERHTNCSIQSKQVTFQVDGRRENKNKEWEQPDFQASVQRQNKF
jgi:hypothetical protein